MIPTEKQAKDLWNKYHLPDQKRTHVALVAGLAVWLAQRIKAQDASCMIDKSLLFAAGLLHDIDKAASRLPSEQHPATAVRILKEEGMNEVSEVVATHSLHLILDTHSAPHTWEQKLLYLADKMVKYEIVGVDARFALWRAEGLPPSAVLILDAAYPRVKALEQAVADLIGASIGDIVQMSQREVILHKNT